MEQILRAMYLRHDKRWIFCVLTLLFVCKLDRKKIRIKTVVGFRFVAVLDPKAYGLHA